ncbi:unnamed protein product [Caenorhabditis nigoni]
MSGPIHYHPESSNQGNVEQPIETANAPASVPLTAFSLWTVTMLEIERHVEQSGSKQKEALRSSDHPEFVKKESVLHQVRKPMEQFIIMSVGGTFMSLHCDMAGTWVYYHVKQGHKVSFIALGTEENLDWMASKRPHSWILKELKNELRRVEVRAGESVVLPADCLHLVWTPEDSWVYAGNYLT